MDDLEFRREVYANPYSNDKSLLEAAANDPAKQQFIDELKQLDGKVQDALDVPVPDGLAHRLILRQSIESHNQQKRRSRIHIALAASIAFVFGLSFTFLQTQPSMTGLSNTALNHMYHEASYTLGADGDLRVADVNAKLATFGGKIAEPFTRIYFANYCLFEKQKSLHLIVGDGDERYTVFITPIDENEVFEPYFEDEKYIGRAWQAENVNLVVLVEKSIKSTKESIEMNSVRDKLIFSI